MELQVAVLAAALLVTIAILGGYALALRARIRELEKRERSVDRE